MKILIFVLPLACAFLLLCAAAAISNRNYFDVCFLFLGACAAINIWLDALDYLNDQTRE